MDLRPVPRRSVADGVFEQVAAQILAGTLVPGEALPPERALTEHFQVNRQAVREALQRLSQVGLVDIRHGDATRVTDFRRRAGLGLLPRLLVGADGGADQQVAASVLELRASLGPDVAGRCAARATPAQVGAVNRSFDVLAQSVAGRARPEELARADAAFWDTLVDGCGNVAYQLVFNTLRECFDCLLPAVVTVLAAQAADVDGHRTIAEAVVDNDRGAAEDAAWALLAHGVTADAG